MITALAYFLDNLFQGFFLKCRNYEKHQILFSNATFSNDHLSNSPYFTVFRDFVFTIVSEMLHYFIYFSTATPKLLKCHSFVKYFYFIS